MDDYYSESKRVDCFHCGGKLIPTNDSDTMTTGDIIIDIQIYKCIDCGNRTKIPVYPESQTTILDEIPVPTFIDEKHNHPRA